VNGQVPPFWQQGPYEPELAGMNGPAGYQGIALPEKKPLLNGGSQVQDEIRKK
jgi:hypothetical protein